MGLDPTTQSNKQYIRVSTKTGEKETCHYTGPVTGAELIAHVDNWNRQACLRVGKRKGFRGPLFVYYTN